MPINIIVNGYFRSGTTFLWNYIKDAFPKYLSFYEPLHDFLPSRIEKERISNTYDDLHSKYLWKAYIGLPNEILNEIYTTNPNSKKQSLNSFSSLKNYFDIFNSFKEPIFIKDNRLSYYLDELSKEYHTKIMHIVRDPVSVLDSIEKAFLGYHKRTRDLLLKDNTKYLYRKAFKAITLCDAFAIKKSYLNLLLTNKFAKPTNFVSNMLIKASYKDMFTATWVISNYYAIKSLQSNNGLILSYKELLAKPNEVKKVIEDYVGTPLNTPLVVRKGTSQSTNTKRIDSLNRVKKLNLTTELNYINSKVAY